MAAYAALVSLMNDLELIPNHPTHSFSFDNKQITSLSQTVHFLIHFIENYDSHGCITEAAEVLESQITFAAHAAHDVIESHVVDQVLAGSTLAGKAKSYFLLDLQKAIDNMDFVKRKAMQFQAKSGLKAEQPTYSTPTSSQPLKDLMVGFDAPIFRLMEMLTGEPSSQRVIPIVGMGGIGKTTLAQKAYEHLLIQHHFDVRLWATISQEYSVETILTELLFRVRTRTGENVSELGEKLHKKLWSRRYLIVLDDMWSVEAWNEIHMFLPDNGNGSCVIVTSRLSNLAAHLSSSPFVMNFLDEDKSWQLFCGKAFGEEDCPLELEEIGKKIVKRCRGLPLSIIVIGGHLRRSSRAIEYWEKFANYMNPISSIVADDQCLKIINLSYEHLPARLKPCFLYMGVFREDEWIAASEVRNFWVAEGFLKPNKSQSLEEAAKDYLNDLIDRNLILVRSKNWYGKVRYCGIHDIVRELCLKVAKKEKFMCVLEGTTEGIQRERRVVIPKGKLNSDMVDALESALLVRSLRPQGVWFLDELSLDLRSLRLLRVSPNVNNMVLKKDGRCFPAAHFQQVNLRHLVFLCTENVTERSLAELPYFLPPAISLFWNMQTLIVENLDVLIIAPYEIWEMTQLRHLEFVKVCLPNLLHDDESNQEECIVLRNLHTLLGVENLRLTEEVCIRMPNIKELGLSYKFYPGEECEASSYYCFHNLGRFSKLESLRCGFDYDPRWHDIFSSLRFPASLELLSLWNCYPDWEDTTVMMKSLPHLVYLLVNSVRGPTWDLADEEFPCLKVLRIFTCDDLIDWNANSSHFPVLEILHIWTVPKLREIPSDFGEIPTLGCIQLHQCGVSAAVSAIKIVAERESFGNQDLQLEVHFREKNEKQRFQEMMQEQGLKINNLRLRLR